MTLWLAAVSALLLAFLAALALSRREPAHRAVAAVLAWGLVVDLVVGTPHGWGVAGYLAPRHPLAGSDVVLYHLATALVTSWPAALVVGAWWVFGKSTARGEGGAVDGLEAKDPRGAMPASPGADEARSSPTESTEVRAVERQHAASRTAVKATLTLWLLANILLVAVVPREQGAVQRALLVVEVAALVGGAAAAIRGWSGPAWRAPQGVMLGLLAAELVVVTLGPFRYSVYERWDLAQVVYSLAFVALAVAQVAAWRRLRPRRQDPG